MTFFLTENSTVTVEPKTSTASAQTSVSHTQDSNNDHFGSPFEGWRYLPSVCRSRHGLHFDSYHWSSPRWISSVPLLWQIDATLRLVVLRFGRRGVFVATRSVYRNHVGLRYVPSFRDCHGCACIQMANFGAVALEFSCFSKSCSFLYIFHRNRTVQVSSENSPCLATLRCQDNGKLQTVYNYGQWLGMNLFQFVRPVESNQLNRKNKINLRRVPGSNDLVQIRNCSACIEYCLQCSACIEYCLQCSALRHCLVLFNCAATMDRSMIFHGKIKGGLKPTRQSCFCCFYEHNATD
eukprot:g38775.t1